MPRRSASSMHCRRIHRSWHWAWRTMAIRARKTTRNIQLNQEFTVNIVSDALVEVLCRAVCSGFSELAAAGLTAIPGTTVKCPRIGEAPVAGCRRMALNIGQSQEIIFGEVLMAHVRDELIDPKPCTSINRGWMRWAHSHGYTRT